ncbi:hypothetical protein Tco_1003705 [Tanacetum coccineum]|uniref:Uncharacterized protein n=1 Tax=Tanacetum coccineum TaxID=301880 RepID=A0ABQ5FC40_9ASTR
MEVNEKAFIHASMGYDNEMIPKSQHWVERLNTNSKLSNFNTGRILILESQAINESLGLTEASSDPESSKESRERFGLDTTKHTKLESQAFSSKNVSGTVTVECTEPATSPVPTKV